MPIQPTIVSVILPVSLAIERVKRMLFQPFALNKWFLIGFCAWLAGLGEAGFSGSFNFNGGSQPTGKNVQLSFDEAWSFLMANFIWIIPLVVALILLVLALIVVMAWLSSRGKFMFLHCVAHNQAEVNVPWRKFARQGNSLFWFRIVLGLISLVPALPLLAVMGVVAIRMFRQQTPDAVSIFALIVVVLALVAVGFVFIVINNLTTDFVVPIMFLRGSRCVEAWREFLGLLTANFGSFVLCLLFQVVLGIATGLLVLGAIIVTCCLACCLMIIPYIGTVLLLPILIFKRAYSLHYLAQYGRPYDVFPAVPPLLQPNSGQLSH